MTASASHLDAYKLMKYRCDPFPQSNSDNRKFSRLGQGREGVYFLEFMPDAQIPELCAGVGAAPSLESEVVGVVCRECQESCGS